MTDGRNKQKTITALPPQAVTDPPRVSPPRARSLEVTSCSLSQLRAAQARSPPRSQSWPMWNRVPNGKPVALGSRRQKTTRPVMAHRPCGIPKPDPLKDLRRGLVDALMVHRPPAGGYPW
jgi:hypothetical protein